MVGQAAQLLDQVRLGRQRAGPPDDDGQVGDEQRDDDAVEVEGGAARHVQRHFLAADVLVQARRQVAVGSERGFDPRLVFGRTGDDDERARRVVCGQVLDDAAGLRGGFVVFGEDDHVGETGTDGEAFAGVSLAGGEVAELRQLGLDAVDVDRAARPGELAALAV